MESVAGVLLPASGMFVEPLSQVLLRSRWDWTRG